MRRSHPRSEGEDFQEGVDRDHGETGVRLPGRPAVFNDRSATHLAGDDLDVAAIPPVHNRCYGQFSPNYALAARLTRPVVINRPQGARWRVSHRLVSGFAGFQRAPTGPDSVRFSDVAGVRESPGARVKGRKVTTAR